MFREQHLRVMETESIYIHMRLTFVWFLTWDRTEVTSQCSLLLPRVQSAAGKTEECEVLASFTGETNRKGKRERIPLTLQINSWYWQKTDEREGLKIETEPLIKGTDITLVVLSWAFRPLPVSVDQGTKQQEEGGLATAAKFAEAGGFWLFRFLELITHRPWTGATCESDPLRTHSSQEIELRRAHADS